MIFRESRKVRRKFKVDSVAAAAIWHLGGRTTSVSDTSFMRSFFRLSILVSPHSIKDSLQNGILSNF